MSHSELDAIVAPYSIVASNTSGGDYPNQQSQWHNQTTTAAAAAVPEQSGGNETLMVLQFYEETRAFERQVGIIIPSIFAVFAFFGLIGNLLVVIVALNRQMRNSTNTLIIGLTCSDLMFLTLCIPFTAIDYAFPQWVLPTWMCPLINYLQHSSAYFSVWTLTLMAADRFLAVVFPVESMTLRTPKNTFFVLVVVYSVILVSQIQVGRIHAVYNYTFIMEERSACSIVSITKGEATVAEARLYFFSFNVFGYCLPLGITCVLYYFMLKRLWYAPLMSGGGGSSTKCSSMLSTNANNSANSSLRSRPETIRAKRKVTRLVLCVVIIWAVCWLPLNLCFFASGLIYPDTLVLRGGKPIVIVQICSQVLAYCNSTLNPILYPLVSENFRKGFLRVLCCMANWLSCGRCCKQFQVYNARMELTMLNRTNSNKSRQISRSNSKSNSIKTTQNQMREQTAQSEPSMLSLLHRQSLKRCSAVSIQGANGNARLRLLSRGESASFLTVGGGHHNGDLHGKYSSSLLIQLPPHPHQQQLQQQRRMSRISAPLYDPYHHRPSQHSLLSMRRTNLSGEDVSVVAEEEKSGERDQETGVMGNGRILGDGGEKNGTGGAEKESLATGGRRRKDSTSCRDCGTEQYRFEEGDQQI